MTKIHIHYFDTPLATVLIFTLHTQHTTYLYVIMTSYYTNDTLSLLLMLQQVNVRSAAFAAVLRLEQDDSQSTPFDSNIDCIAMKMLGIPDRNEHDPDLRLTDDIKLHARVAIQQIIRFADPYVIDDDHESALTSLHCAMDCILGTDPSVIYWRHNIHDSYGFTPVLNHNDAQIDKFNEWINDIVRKKQSGLNVNARAGPTHEFLDFEELGQWSVLLLDIGGTPCYPYHCIQNLVGCHDARWTPVFFRDINARNHTLSYINSY